MQLNFQFLLHSRKDYGFRDVYGDRNVGLRGFLHQGHPEKIKSIPPDHRCQMVTFDLGAHWLPGRPHLVGIAAVEVLVWLAVGATENMQVAPRGIGVVLDVHGHDVEPGQLIQLFEVVEEGVFHQIAGNVALQQRALEFGEQVRLVVAKLRLQPVLRKQKDLAIRFPHAIALHPFPLLGVDGGRMDLHLQIQQAALDEQLQ